MSANRPYWPRAQWVCEAQQICPVDEIRGQPGCPTCGNCPQAFVPQHGFSFANAYNFQFSCDQMFHQSQMKYSNDYGHGLSFNNIWPLMPNFRPANQHSMISLHSNPFRPAMTGQVPLFCNTNRPPRFPNQNTFPKQRKTFLKQTPTSELNTLISKYGMQAKYSQPAKVNVDLSVGSEFSGDDQTLCQPRSLKTSFPPAHNGMYLNRFQSPGQASIPLMVQQNNVQQISFTVELQIDYYTFEGTGKTTQEARHNAASEALKFFQSSDILKTRIKNKGKERKKEIHKNNRSNSETNNTGSPISTVYEFVKKTNMHVKFDVINESGEQHSPTFIIACSIMKYLNDKKPYLYITGKDGSKKSAKKNASENMLKILKEKGLITYNFEPIGLTSPSQVTVATVSANEIETVMKNYTILKRDTLRDSPEKEASLPKTKDSQCFSIMANEDKASTSQDLLTSSQGETSSKVVTFLHQITRNLQLKAPRFEVTKLNKSNEIVQEYLKSDPLDSKVPLEFFLTQVECFLEFNQTLPKNIKCSIRTFGFSPDEKVAKSVAAYICLLRMGFKLVDIVHAPEFEKTLEFSFSRKNSPFEQDEMLNEIDFDKTSKKSLDELSGETNRSIQNNCRFVLHILQEHYLPIFRFSLKNIETVFEKLVTSFNNFIDSLNCVAQGNNTESNTKKANSIESLVTSLDATKNWHHLQLLSSLTSIGDNGLSTVPSGYLKFRCHIVESEPLPGCEEKHYIAIIKANCGPMLSSTTINFNLIKNNFVNFGLGTSKEGAKEIASYWTLRNLSYIAMKQIIENNFNSKSDTITSPKRSSTSDSTKSSQSKPSVSEAKTKNSITSLNEICQFMKVKLSNEKSATLTTEHIPQEKIDELRHKLSIDSSVPLFYTRYHIEVPREVSSNHSVAKLQFFGLGNSTRSARSTAASFALLALGTPFDCDVILEFFKSSPNMALFFSYSRPCNSAVSVDFDPFTIANFEPKISDESIFVANRNEIIRNVELVDSLLGTIYQPFLRSKRYRKQSISQLLFPIKQIINQYYNQNVQQDNSIRLKQYSEMLIEQMKTSYATEPYWQQLKLIERLISTVSSDNVTNLLTELAVEFQCSVFNCSVTRVKQREEEVNETIEEQLSETAKVALIRLKHNWLATKKWPLFSRTFISMGMGDSEQAARNRVSYLALRHLINNIKAAHR